MYWVALENARFSIGATFGWHSGKSLGPTVSYSVNICNSYVKHCLICWGYDGRQEHGAWVDYLPRDLKGLNEKVYCEVLEKVFPGEETDPEAGTW